MSDEIQQNLGFDAGNTFSTLANLDAAFTKFSAALNNVAGGAKRFNDVANRTSKSMSNLNNQSKKLMVSWETLSRVIQTQVLVRSLNVVRNAFRNAYNSQIEYSKVISEIKAIDPARTYGQIADNVRRLSDAFSQPLAIVAEAQYETLSDQFTSAAEQAHILSAANLLAKTTEDDLVGSTQLLTGALNAYGESSDMAKLRAAQFFESINLGRFRATELGNALGKIQSIGAEVGLSMEELQAGLIAITIGGVKATEAATQLRGILNALLKPSDAMKKALDDIGVESGPAAVRTFGFHEALVKVKETTDGSATAIGKLIPRVRGAVGAFRLLGAGAMPFTEALDSLNQTDTGAFQGKAFEAMSTQAARLSKELNKLKSFLTAELGAEIVENMNALINLLGGGKGLVGALRFITSEGPKAAAAIGLMTLATKAWGVQMDWAFHKLNLGFNLGIRKLNTFRTAFALLATYEIGRILGNQIGDMISDHITAPFNEAREALNKAIELNKEQTQVAIREKDRENTAIMQKLRQRTALAAIEYQVDRDNFQVSMKSLEVSAGRAFDNILGRYKQLSQSLSSLSDETWKKSANSMQKALNIEQDIKTRNTIFAIKDFPLRTQFSLFARELNKATRYAAKLQSTALDDNQQKLADAAWSRADAYAQLVQSSAQESKNNVIQRQAINALQTSDQARANSYKELGKLQRQASIELETQSKVAEEHYAILLKGREKIEAKLSAWSKDDAGDLVLKNPEEAKKDLAQTDALIKEWVSKVQTYAKGDFLKNFMGDARALESVKRDAERMLASIYLKDLQLAPEAVAQLWDNLQESADQLRLKIKAIVEIEDVTNMNVVQHGIDAVYTEYEKHIKALSAQALTSGMNDKAIKEAQDAYKQQRDLLSQETFPIQRGSAGRGLEKLGVLTKLNPALIVQTITEMDRLSSSTTATAAEFQKLGATLQSDEFKSAQSSLSVKAQEAIATMGVSLLKIKEARQQQLDIGPVDQNEQQRIQAIQQQIDAENQLNNSLQQQKNSIDAAKSGIDNQVSSINAAISDAGSYELSWWRVASAIQAAATMAAQVPAGGAVTTAAFGGPIGHFDAGGNARGMDTIPAMLSKGEFVMNPKATQQWYSQLVAMNSGGQPNYKSEGGATTNAGIVGDISITVNGGGNKQVGRDIAAVLNREIRRGSSKLRR